jgi:hypothetical protein
MELKSKDSNKVVFGRTLYQAADDLGELLTAFYEIALSQKTKEESNAAWLDVYKI